MSSESLALERVLPDYGGRCITEVIPGLLAGHPTELVGNQLASAPTVVLVMVDGLGWHQLRRHRSVAPALAAAADAAAPITTVAPSTTAAALASLTTGAAPGEHGLVGYRVPTSAGLLNTLRWRAGGKDARAAVPAHELQPVLPFCGQPVAVVTRAEFRDSGFSTAHLRGGAFWGWRDADPPKKSSRQSDSSGASQRAAADSAADARTKERARHARRIALDRAIREITECVREAVAQRFRLVYAYFDTLDKVAHEFGIGDEYLATLNGAERLAAAIRSAVPSEVPVVITADHGVVDVPDPPVVVDPDIVALTGGWSGEARMLWLHARPGAAADLLDACQRYAPIAEVAPLSQVLDERWLGRHVSPQARSRLGDLVLVPTATQAFAMPDDKKPSHPLIGRHGGLTAEEMLVPFLQL